MKLEINLQVNYLNILIIIAIRQRKQFGRKLKPRSHQMHHGICTRLQADHIPPRPLLDLEVVTIKSEGCVITLGP